MKETQRQRARRDTRRSDPTPMRLTERDLDILQAVYACRVLTTQQLQMLFFPSLPTAYARLSLLYHQGLLDRKFLAVYADKMNTPILYVLDRQGAEVLQRERGIEVNWSREAKHVTITFLEHTLAINQVRVALDKACWQTDGFELLEWLGENELKADYDRVTIRTDSGRSQNISLIPDSYFSLQTPRGVAHFFLELDRGTMTTKRFKSKILAYQVYYASGAYQRRYGTRSLRVLTVTTTTGRTESLRKMTEHAGGKQRYWFATLDQISPQTILKAPIWQVATRDDLQPLIGLEG
ncbi:MAG: replication-relaxation family protein [Chloroflexota bacterium]